MPAPARPSTTPRRKAAHEAINQTSNRTEFGSPPAILEMVRGFFNGIELDPASTPEMNRVVQAERIHTLADKDYLLKRPWIARTLWLNHPFGARITMGAKNWKEAYAARGYPEDQPYVPGNADWINKLISEHQKGNVAEAICITFAATSEKWFRPLLDFPQCFLYPRTNYYTPSGEILKGVNAYKTHGAVKH